MDDLQQSIAFSFLTDISDIEPIYILPKEKRELIDNVFVPALKSSLSYDCMTAFFHPSALKQLAYGLTSFINNKPSNMRLLISPFLNDEVRNAINRGYSEAQDEITIFLKDLYGEVIINENSLINHTMQCLSYLIAQDRLDIKFVFMKKEGNFHPKIYIFNDTSEQLVVSGSNNYTSRAFLNNLEQTQVSKSWGSDDSKIVVKKLNELFEELWDNKETDLTYTYQFKEAFDKDLIKDYPTNTPPAKIEFEDALDSDIGDTILNKEKQLIIPEYINYEEGTYSFQGEAVKRWEENNCCGILAMATGSGKTITSLIAATRLSQQGNPLLIIITAPYIPLVEQWADEVKKFSYEPIPLYKYSSKDKISEIERIIRLLNNGKSNLKIVIATNNLFKDKHFLAALDEAQKDILLIADEVHNLGTSSIINDPPQSIKYRLGLSATPERQYDDEGSEKLFNYFHGIVYEFSLEDAIQSGCLVNYNYYVHPIYLTDEENEDFIKLSKRIRYLLGAKKDEVYDEYGSGGTSEIDLLRFRRRRIIEQAKNKFLKFEELFSSLDRKEIKYTLVYCSDKFHEQLDHVNNLMRKLKVKYHQVTSQETSDKILLKNILDEFSDGKTKQVLTSMRVLDEGVNIPQISTAYILASTTVKRQWVQRRGRVLRTCDDIGKRRAYLHDFLVLPSINDEFSKNLIQSELERVTEFGELSLNFNDSDGAYTIIDNLME